MGSRTEVYRKRVADVMRPAPVWARPEDSIRDVVGRMTAEKVSAVVVAGDGGGGAGRPLGILTEQDVTRRVALRATPETPLSDLMTTPVRTVRDDEYLYQAIAVMRRLGHRHMPVVARDGRLVGMLGLADAQALLSEQLTDHIDRLTGEATIDGLRDVKAAQVELAEDLFADAVPVPEIQALLTEINNDLYRRVVRRGLRAMEEEGAGAPPRPFAVIVMGSGGRGESFLFPDQDNGFIIADYPDAEHDRVDGWFRRLADRMCTELDAVGFPLCRGYVMAVNPLWRKTLPQWREQLRLWARRRNAVTLRLADIFFDFKAVYGEPAMADTLRGEVTRLVSRNPVVVQAMYRDDAEHAVALGLFNRFITERGDGPNRGKINLKHTGTLPLVEAIRLMALRAGIPAVGTLERLAGLQAAGVVDVDEVEDLTAAYQQLTRLLLRQQIADFQAGAPVGNYVHPNGLGRRDRALLVAAFKTVKRFRGRVRSEVTGEIF